LAGRPSPGISAPGLAALLAVIFTALRLARAISWSWWWVLAPLWGLAGLVLLIFAGIVGTAAIDRHVSVSQRKRALTAISWRWSSGPRRDNETAAAAGDSHRRLGRAA
jgi:Transmembrane Fragile-X-F protein